MFIIIITIITIIITIIITMAINSLIINLLDYLKVQRLSLLYLKKKNSINYCNFYSEGYEFPRALEAFIFDFYSTILFFLFKSKFIIIYKNSIEIIKLFIWGLYFY